MQEIVWIRENLDKYHEMFGKLEKQNELIHDKKKQIRISGDLDDLKRRIDENLSEHREKLYNQRYGLVNSIVSRVIFRRICLLEAFDYELQELESWFTNLVA